MKRTRMIVAALILTATACDAGSDDQGSTADTTTLDAPATDPAVTNPADSNPTASDPPDSDPDVTDPASSDQPPVSDPVSDPNATAPPATLDRGSSTTVSATPPPVAQPLYDAGDIDRGLQPFIDQAIEDIATRLGVDASTITTRAAVLVVWPDASLGCPQPDMEYAQVLTDGSVIELEHDGNVYRYHTGGTSGPFICEQPITKAPPTELLTLDDFDN